MKRILYSSYTKFIAVLLFAVCVMLAVSVAINALVMKIDNRQGIIYRFEREFEQNQYFVTLLETPQMRVYEAYADYYQNDSGALTLQEQIQGKLAYFEDSKQVNYFISINGTVFTNCGAASKEELLDERFFLLTERNSYGDTHYDSSQPEHNSFYLNDIYQYNKTDEIIICASINEAYATEFEGIWSTQEMYAKSVLTRLICCASMGIILFVYLMVACGKSADGKRKLTGYDAIWTEIHIAIIFFSIICACLVGVCFFDEYTRGSVPLYMMKPTILISAVMGSLLCLASFLSLARKIKCRTFLKSSIIFKIAKRLWSVLAMICKWIYQKVTSCLKVTIRGLSKKTGVLLIVLLFVYTAMIGLCGIFVTDSLLFFMPAITLFVLAAFFVACRASDIDEIKKGVAKVRDGNLSYKITDIRSEDLKALAADVDEISIGLDKSVAARVKAERLKTELITNVSHDLKTPLTSIINYTELLSKVDSLPEEAKDYIRIIAKKSDRLRQLTQDLFDISKVQSGNENLVFEKLDISLLISQTLGEHDAEIRESELTFCVNTEKELYISADGRKMSRVISNLVSNILKYTMKNTRVFISAADNDGEVTVEFKNIASYPMDFDDEEIIGRFVRGDESRSIDGNGLGLAIAKSYTEACGGQFRVLTDGDLFKAIIVFKKYN